VQIDAGQTTFTAPEPLAEIDDIGGVLCVGSLSYNCSIVPGR
jgi:hypothetical protein